MLLSRIADKAGIPSGEKIGAKDGYKLKYGYQDSQWALDDGEHSLFHATISRLQLDSSSGSWAGRESELAGRMQKRRGGIVDREGSSFAARDGRARPAASSVLAHRQPTDTNTSYWTGIV